MKERCIRNHLLIGKNVYTDKNGHHYCKKCHAMWSAAWRTRHPNYERERYAKRKKGLAA